MEENNIKDKAYRKGLVIIIILLMLLVFTSIVLAQTLYGTVAGNSFTLGTIKIDIGYYVNIKDEITGKVKETIGPVWTKNMDETSRKLIEKNALVNNNPKENVDYEIFGNLREGDDEAYNIITRQFSIKNDSDNGEFYRLYFTNVKGKLADIINVKIIDVTNLSYSYENPETHDTTTKDFSTHYLGDLDKCLEGKIEGYDYKILFDDVATKFTEENVAAFEDVLEGMGIRHLLIRFEYPDTIPNEHRDYTNDLFTLGFDLCAEAVQKKNNDEKEFN